MRVAGTGSEAVEADYVASAAQLRGTRVREDVDGPSRGLRVLEMYTDKLRIEVLVDRAGDIGRAEYAGRPFSWTSSTGYVPASLSGDARTGFLDSFPGGLLATCGLEHVFGAETEELPEGEHPHLSRREYPLHGSLWKNGATLRGHGVSEGSEGHIVWCELEVRQAVFFGENLLLNRRIELDGERLEVRVHDQITNAGPARAEVMIDYHCNFGYPLVSEGARVFGGQAGTASGPVLIECPKPLPENRESVTATPISPEGSPDSVELWSADGEWGIRQQASGDLVRFRVLWEYFQARQYVLGLEYASNTLDGRVAARKRGELVELRPGGTVRNRIQWQILTRGDATKGETDVRSDA